MAASTKTLLRVAALCAAAGCGGSGEGGGAGADTAAPTFTIDPAFGLSPWGVVDEGEPDLDRIASLDADEVWATVYWNGVDPDAGEWPWAALDAALDQLEAQGVGLSLKLRIWSGDERPPEEMLPADGSFPGDAVIEAYAAWVGAMAGRYRGRVRAWAIENEVSAEKFWQGTWEQYLSYFDAAAAAIREADPAARVADFGMPSPVYGGAIAAELLEAGERDEAVRFFADYFAQRDDRYACAAFGGLPADADELEALLFRATGEGSDDAFARRLEIMDAHFDLFDRADVYQLHFYESWRVLPEVLDWIRARLEASGASPEIEIWELGHAMYGTCGDSCDCTAPTSTDPEGYDAELHARRLERLLVVAFGEGAARVHYLPVQSHDAAQGELEDHQGLYDPDGAARPAVETWVETASRLRGRTAARRVAAGRDVERWTYEFDDGTLTASWTGNDGPVEWGP